MVGGATVHLASRELAETSPIANKSEPYGPFLQGVKILENGTWDVKNVKKEREAFKVEKIKNEKKFPFRTLTPHPPRLNGNSLDSPNPPGMEMSIHFFYLFFLDGFAK